MIFHPIHPPGPWQYYVNRRDNIGLPIMEVRRKYLAEQLRFEDFQQQQMMMLAGAPGGGPSIVDSTPSSSPSPSPTPPPLGNYLLTEEGDIITDENGNPIILEG